MKGILFGLFMVFGLTLGVLSLRPGGIRRQGRLIARRLRLALLLTGAFLLLGAILRLVLGDSRLEGELSVALIVVLALTFLVLAQDPPAA
ncbi:MAG TPA: hypothetical protein VNI34_05030 [Candidatus Nitrosotalea sp.]|nr:hypothetical protein [Candidatus Nitrosotalea sp.]